MRKTTLTFCLVLALGLGQAAALRAGVQAATDESLFREAKLLVFDKSWKAALEKIDELVDKFPSSPLAGQALFYKGECLSGLGGREREALRAYKDYIALDDAKPSLVEESEGSIVDLAFDLYEGGERLRPPGDREPARPWEQGHSLLRGLQAEPRLRQEGGGQGRAGPVEDRRDREGPRAPRPGPHRPAARLAGKPEDAPRTESPGSGSTARLLRIRVRKAGQREPVFSLNIPFALADLALSAMDEDDKAAIRKKGYDIAKIIDELSKSKESILRIVGDDGTIIEIWID